MLPFPSPAPAPHLSCGPALSLGTCHSPEAAQEPRVCSASGMRCGCHGSCCSPSSSSPGRQPRPGHPCSPLSPPLPSALGFQTESKMGSHQIRCVFSQGNFPFIASLLREALSSFLCLVFFWVFGDKLLVVVFEPCGQQPSRSLIQNVSRKPVVTLIGVYANFCGL